MKRGEKMKAKICTKSKFIFELGRHNFDVCGNMEKQKSVKFGLNTYINLKRRSVTLTYEAEEKSVMKNAKTWGWVWKFI